MADWRDLPREYEARRFPPMRRLDLHGEGPARARERALHWIQSRAHEEPGQELLLIVERGRHPGRPPSPVRRAVERLLTELQGRLVEWWQDFGTGGLAVRISAHPRMHLPASPEAPAGEERPRFDELHQDIPEELRPLAWRIAEMRRDREGLSPGLMEVVLRRVWIEAQAMAMEQRIGFGQALDRLMHEEARFREEDLG